MRTSNPCSSPLLGIHLLAGLLACSGLAAPALAQGDFYDVDLSQPGGPRVLGALKGIYVAQPGGLPQATAYSSGAEDGPVQEVAIDPNDPDLWLGAVDGGSKLLVAHLTNGGTSTSTIATGGQGVPTDLEFSPFEQDVVLVSQSGAPAGEPGIFFSEDGGWSWQGSDNSVGLDIAEIAHSKNGAGSVIAMTTSGSRISSTNGGRSWSLPSPQLPARPLSLINSRHTPFLWYATTADKGVWRSDDGAVTWTQLPALGVSIHENPNVPDMVWLATSSGRLQFSGNRGTTWSTERTISPFNSSDLILDVDFDPNQGKVLLSGQTDKYAETDSAVTGLGSATQGSGGVRPRSFLGDVVSPGNPGFSFKGDRCVGDSLAVYFVSRSEGVLPLFGGTVYLAGNIVTSFVAKAEAPFGQSGNPGAGSFEVAAPLPFNPAIVGAKFITQFAVIDGGAADPSTIVLSAGLRVIGQP